ncbi:uncharacterized protein METZ01_LOCUS25397 [marine metagenome]|uniref:Uncharacterized protein n=1 Tax=marine metagenome TaxID=408172 RepID=A0A381Q4L3_9ZZZZ
MRWTDNHCHLPDDGDRAAEVVEEARKLGVERLIDVGTSVEHSITCCSKANRFEGVWATAGVHPHAADEGIDGLETLLSSSGVVAVGECGLDYHYDNSPRDTQRQVFADQIQLAHRYRLPLVIHTREAWKDTFDILDAEGVPERTVFHCFTGGPEEAKSGLERGASLSFSGIITFPNAPELRAAAALTPADRYMVETDAPYLAPVPKRGKQNRPGWVALVGAGVALARGVEIETVATESWNNASTIYRFAR